MKTKVVSQRLYFVGHPVASHYLSHQLVNQLEDQIYHLDRHI